MHCIATRATHPVSVGYHLSFAQGIAVYIHFMQYRAAL